jgi:hypothetical protein
MHHQCRGVVLCTLSPHPLTENTVFGEGVWGRGCSAQHFVIRHFAEGSLHSSSKNPAATTFPGARDVTGTLTSSTA